jgi:hypothetical protein
MMSSEKPLHNCFRHLLTYSMRSLLLEPLAYLRHNTTCSLWRMLDWMTMAECLYCSRRANIEDDKCHLLHSLHHHCCIRSSALCSIQLIRLFALHFCSQLFLSLRMPSTQNIYSVTLPAKLFHALAFLLSNISFSRRMMGVVAGVGV